MEPPKLRLWAKLIQNGRHVDYDKPPDIPFITGAPTPVKPRKQNVADTLSAAIVKAIKGSPPRSETSSTDCENKKISPLKLTTIRRNCLDDLKRLKNLYEDDVLSEQEYAEEKKSILATLKTLK